MARTIRQDAVTVGVNVLIDRDLHRRLRVYAIVHDLSMREAVSRLLDKALPK
jgi:hypothetical protein